MSTRNRLLQLLTAALLLTAQIWAPAAVAQASKPNILVIMGDDVGWFNIGAYHQGIMSGKTPNLDKLASQGMRFTDYYAEASCTAGRANFITGELPIRTGLTTVGQAGADVGLPAQAATLATGLKTQGYATGQFGKNHLGDLNKYLPTVHGFNDFFAREFWRFVIVQQYVEKLALTAVDYPPMQAPASFNLDAVKKKVEEMIKNHPGQ